MTWVQGAAPRRSLVLFLVDRVMQYTWKESIVIHNIFTCFQPPNPKLLNKISGYHANKDKGLNLCVILLCSMKMKEMLSSSSSSSSSKVRTDEEEGEEGGSHTISGERLGLKKLKRLVELNFECSKCFEPAILRASG